MDSTSPRELPRGGRQNYGEGKCAMPTMYSYIQAYTHIRVCANICVFIYVYYHADVHMHTCTLIHTCKFLTYVHAYVHVCVYEYPYIYIQLYTHMYTCRLWGRLWIRETPAKIKTAVWLSEMQQVHCKPCLEKKKNPWDNKAPAIESKLSTSMFRTPSGSDSLWAYIYIYISSV